MNEGLPQLKSRPTPCLKSVAGVPRMAVVVPILQPARVSVLRRRAQADSLIRAHICSS